MIIGIGVDLLNLSRLAGVIERRGYAPLARRICTESERDALATAVAESRRRQTGTLNDIISNFLALRWTAKEAAFKALYPTRRANWQTLVVRKDDGRKPLIEYTGDRNVTSPFTLHLSVSHEGQLMIANVVAEQRCG